MSIFDGFPRGVPGKDNRNAALGTASWSTKAPLWTPGMIFLGLDDEGREVGYIDDRHVVTVAGSRGGKGISCILPNLRRWPGSCAVLDPKGENATVTAAVRAAMPGHKVAVVDPHGVAKVADDLRASFNPLDLIDADQDGRRVMMAVNGSAINPRDKSIRQNQRILVMLNSSSQTGLIRAITPEGAGYVLSGYSNAGYTPNGEAMLRE